MRTISTPYNLTSFSMFQELQKANKTLDYARLHWPLQSRAAGERGGYKIRGMFNATGFIEEGMNNSFDAITVIVSDPFSDAASSAILTESIRLLPCERLILVLEVEERHLLNREESPCIEGKVCGNDQIFLASKVVKH